MMKNKRILPILGIILILALTIVLGNTVRLSASDTKAFDDFSIAERYAVGDGGLQPAKNGTDYGSGNTRWEVVGFSLIYGGTTTIMGDNQTGFFTNKTLDSRYYGTSPTIKVLAGNERIYESSIYTKIAGTTAYQWHNIRFRINPASFKGSSVLHGRSLLDNLLLEVTGTARTTLANKIAPGGTGWLNGLMSAKSSSTSAHTAVNTGKLYKDGASAYSYPIRTFLTYTGWRNSGSWPASSYETVALYFEIRLNLPMIPEADETAPSVALSPMNNASYVYTQNVTITGSDTGGSGLASIYYQHRVNSSAWSGATYVSSGHVIGIGSTGYNEIWGVSTDGAGNQKSVHGAYYYVDRLAPDAPAVNRNSSGWQKVNPTFTVTGGADAHSGLASRQYKIGGGAWTGYSTTVSVSNQGATTIYGRTVDNVGNISSQVSTVVYKDTVAPSSPTINRSRTGWGNTSATFTLTHGTDATSGVLKSQYRIGSGSWTDYSGTVTVSNAGATTIYARTIDNAWNYSSETSTTVYNDTVAPHTTAYSLSGYQYSSGSTYWYAPNTTFVFDNTGYDALSGIRNQYIRLGGSTDIRAHHDWNAASTHFNPWITANGAVLTGVTRISNSGGSYRLQWTGTTQAYDYDYDVQYYYGDWAGNVVGYNNTGMLLKIDASAPSAPTITTSPASWTNGNVTVSLSHGSDSRSGVNRSQYKIGSGAWTNYTGAFTISTTGQTIIYGRTIDNVGNISATSSKYTYIDRTAPSGTTSISPSTWTNGDVTLTFTGTDTESGVQRVRISGGTWVTGATTTRVVSANGTYSFEVQDNAGNTNTVSYTVTNIDKVNPSHVSAAITGHQYQNGNDYWVSGNSTFNFEVRGTDDASGIKYLYGRFSGGTSDARSQHHVDGLDTHNNQFATATDISFDSALRTYKSGLTAAVRWVMSVTNVENDYTVFYYHRDAATNTIGYNDTYMNLRVDSSAPTMPSISLSPSAWTNGDVVVSVTGGIDSRSGVLRTEYKIGAGAWTTYSTPITVTAPGTTVIYARTIDRVGNISSTASIPVRIDRTAPTGIVTPSTTGWTAGTVTLTVSPSDLGGSGYYNTRLPNGTYTTSLTPTYVVSANGTYTFTVFDNAGNASSVSRSVTNIDHIPPTVPTINPSRTNWGNTNITFTLTHGADAHSGVSRSEYRLDNGAWITYTGTVTVSKSGVSKVDARTIDNVGNISGISTVNVLKDTTPPTVTANPTSSDWVDDKVTVNLTYADTESGIAIQQYAWSLTATTPAPGAWVNYTGPIEQSAQGIWYLHYRAVDNVGYETIGNFGVYKVKRETGLKLTNLRVTPQIVVLKEGQTSAVRKMSVTFNISNLLFPNHGRPINPVVTIKYGTDTLNTTLWTGTVQMPANGNTTKTVDLTNVILSPGKKIIAEVNGVVTGYLRFDEYHYSGINPYADNKQSVSILVTTPTTDVCQLFIDDNASRTANTWSERWTKTTQTAVVAPPYFNVTSRTTDTQVVNYNETYRITDLKFRSKYTIDNRNILMSDPSYTGDISVDGWQTIKRPELLTTAKEIEDNIAKIKAGYGIEMIVETRYTTNRYVVPVGYVESFSDMVFNPTYGNGYANYTVVSPSITPVESPDVLYFNMYDSNGINQYCQEIPVVNSQGSWYSRTKTFERSQAANDRIWTEFHTLPAVYDVNIKTPNGSSIQDKFMGYEQEAPVDMSNKTYLHDTFRFKLQILGQDDIKSHFGN